MPIVHVVTVTYNSTGHLGDFFSCLTLAATRCSHHGIELRTTIVDNASSDGSLSQALDVASASLVDVEVIGSDVNVGIACGNNRGVRSALARGADSILLLNNDVTFGADFVLELVAAHRRWGSTYLVAPRILAVDPPGAIWYDGGFIARGKALRAVHERLGQPAAAVSPVERVTEYASTCALLVPRQVWSVVGLMDEDFFVYCDDLDFAMRVRDAGFHTVVAPRAIMTHKVGASTGGVRSDFGARWETVGRVLILRKHTTTLWGRHLGYAYLLAWIIWQVLARKESLASFRIRALALLTGACRRLSHGRPSRA